VHLQTLLGDGEASKALVKQSLYEVFGTFRHCEFIISKIMAFVGENDVKERFNQMFEFYKCIPFNSKKLKNNSPGLEEIMGKEFQSLCDPHRSHEPVAVSEQDRHLLMLLDALWVKIQERHRDVSSAFRFFDWAGKGKISKSNFINGLDKLNLRFEASDIDSLWHYLDKSRRGFLNFNDFVILQKRPDAKLLGEDFQDVRVQDQMAAMRKKERERIANEIMESVQTRGMYNTLQGSGRFGMVSMPSEKIDKVLNAEYQAAYLQ
jgi:hypothetical protein